MSTLAEIEVAASSLPEPEKEALIQFLTARLRRERMDRFRKPGNLADFSGVLRLAEDPLAWQQRCRDEWA